MAEDVGSLVVRVAMDNSNFQQGIQNLNRSMKVIQSEFKNATAGLKDHGKGLEGLKAKQEMLSKSIDVQSKIVQKYKDKLKESKETLNKNAEAQEKLKSKVEDSKKAYEESKATLGENNAKTKELKASYEQLSSEYAKNEDKLRNNVRAVDNWTTKTNNAESKLKDMQQNLNSVSSSIKQQESAWNKLSKKMESVGKKFENIGKKMESAGKGLTAKITTPIAGLGVVASKIGMDFEASMSNVSALSGATGNDLKQLENKARDAGATTSKSAKDAADALGYMALAGYDNKQMQEALLPVLRLSEAGNLDLARTSDLVTDSLSSLGKSTKDLPVYLDQVAKTAASSNTNIDALMEAFVVCGGTVKNLNVPLDEANTHLGILANRGIKGSEAGNSFNSILINLTSGAGQAGKAMEQLGLSAFDGQGKFKGVSKVLLELKDKTKNMTEEQRNMYLAMIGGKTQITTLQALLSGVSEEYGELKGKIQDSNGALNDMATTMQDNNKGSITELKSALEELGLKIYDVLKPKIAAITKKLQEWTNKLNSLTPAQQQTIIKIAEMVAAIGPLFLIGGKLNKGISKISTSFSTVTGAIAVLKTGAEASTPAVARLSKAFALLNWKVVAVGAAIAGTIVVAKKLHNHFSQASVQQEKFSKDISKSTKKAISEYEKLDKHIGQRLMDIKINNKKITKEIAKDITTNFNQMADKIVAANKKKYDKDYNNLQNFMSKSGALRSDEQMEILNNIKKKEKFEENIVKNGQAKINEIFKKASNENRKLTNEECFVINNIRDNMNKNAIQSMSQSEREQKSLLERQKRNASKLTAEQAADVAKNSATQRDKVIADAEEEYDKTVQNIQRQRDELGTITDEQAEHLISAAEHQKEIIVNKAKGQHEEIVMEAQNQAGEHVDKVDWETGEIKSKWTVMKEDVSKKAHEMKENTIKSFNEKKKAISNKMVEIKTNISKKWNEIVEGFNTLPARLKQKAHVMFESMKQGINDKLASIKKSASNVGEGIKNAFTDIPGKMLNIGHDIMDGLKNGITNKINSVKEAASKAANAVTSKVKSVLDIHSPSRVMMQLGQYTTEGLAIGILDNLSLVEEAVDLTTKTLLKLERNPDIKAKVNVSDQDISKVVNYILSWGDNSEKTYRQFVESVNKMNISELEESKKQLDRLYKDRKRNVEDTLRLVKKGSSKKLELEKANIDKQIAYYRNLQRNTKDKNAKKTYANQIARLQEYKKQVQLISKANTEKQIAELERSKNALQDYYELANRMLTDRKELVQDTLKEETSIFKDNINKYNEAIKLLSINTKDLTQNLINQQAIVNVQNKKIEELEKRYSKLLTTFGATSEETVKIRKELEESKITLINYTNAVEEAQENLYKHNIDTVNTFTNKIKNALQERYMEELKAQEDTINKELSNLNKWKDESIKRINDVYNAKIKALDDEIKAEEKADKDREELKKIHSLEEAIKFEHNEFNKAELQKELNRSIVERNKRLHREDIENKKLSLEQKKQNEISNINNLYEANKNNLEKQLADTKKFYDQKLRMTNLQAEAEKIIIDNNQQEIVELIKSYDKDYETAGKTLGQRLADGMQEKIHPVLDLIDNIQDRINNLRTQEIQASIDTAKYSPIAMGNGSINSTTNNSSTVNNINFNSPKQLAPSEIRRETETTLRNLAFGM